KTSPSHRGDVLAAFLFAGSDSQQDPGDTRMNRNIGFSLLLVAGGLAQPAAAAESIADAFREGKVLIEWRVRFESVEQEDFTETAEALTSRLRAGFKTAELKKTSLLAEAVWIEDA